MAVAIQTLWNGARIPASIPERSFPALKKSPQPLNFSGFSGVFRGYELTRKDRRLSSGLAPLDALLDGGIARGRITEIIGHPGSGRTSLTASFAASASRLGEVTAWIDSSGAFDPVSVVASGVDLGRVLWASFKDGARAPGTRDRDRLPPLAHRRSSLLRAAELVLAAGGFGLVVVDFGDAPYPIPQSAALRLARAAERSGAAVLAIAPRRMCGTFAALSLVLRRVEARFSRCRPEAPVMFDGFAIGATVARNKLGGCGASATVRAAIDPLEQFASAPDVDTASTADDPSGAVRLRERLG